MDEATLQENTLETMEFPLIDEDFPREDSYHQIFQILPELKKKIWELEEDNHTLREHIRHLKEQTRQLDDRVFNLFTISQAGKVFTANPDIKRLSEILLSMCAERLLLGTMALLLIDSKTGNFFVSDSIGLDKDDIRDVIYTPKEGLFWQLIVNGEPFSVVDVEGNLRFGAVFGGSYLPKLKSTTWVPMKTKDNVVGIITLGRNDLTPSDLDYLEQLINQAAVAFETAFLYETIEDSRKELDRQMHNLSILYEVGKAMNFIEDLTKLLVQILDQAIEVVEASKGSLMLLENHELIVRVVRGIDKITEEKIIKGEIQCTKIKLGEGIAGIVAKTGEPLLIEDASNDHRFLASKSSNVDNLMCVPLKIYEEPIGVINMSNKKAGKTFTEEDLRILTTLADQAAVAINNARLYELAVTDGLTKCFLRRHFMQTLDTELKRAYRYKHPLSLLMTDIDHFKKLNDNYGHQAGDKVLVEVSRILRNSTRATDMVGRYGGEEFCIMLPETPTKRALVIAERLRESIEENVIQYMDTEISCTMSIGIATFPRDAENPKELIRMADKALYIAKDTGRNQVIPYSLPDEADEAYALESAKKRMEEIEKTDEAKTAKTIRRTKIEDLSDDDEYESDQWDGKKNKEEKPESKDPTKSKDLDKIMEEGEPGEEPGKEGEPLKDGLEASPPEKKTRKKRTKKGK